MNNADNNDINVRRRPICLNTMRCRHEGLSPLEIDTIQSGHALLIKNRNMLFLLRKLWKLHIN